MVKAFTLAPGSNINCNYSVKYNKKEHNPNSTKLSIK